VVKQLKNKVKKLYNWAEKVISELRSVSDQGIGRDCNTSDDDLLGKEGKTLESQSFITFRFRSTWFEVITVSDLNAPLKPLGENLPDGETESSSES
jgi:hypothetical protein